MKRRTIQDHDSEGRIFEIRSLSCERHSSRAFGCLRKHEPLIHCVLCSDDFSVWGKNLRPRKGKVDLDAMDGMIKLVPTGL